MPFPPVKVFTFAYDLPTFNIYADTYEEAKQRALERLEAHAGSNDGSELLANGSVALTKAEWICYHPPIREHVSSFNMERPNVDGTWRKLRATFIRCRACGSLLEEIEEPRA